MNNQIEDRKSLLNKPIYLNKESDHARVHEEEWQNRKPLTRGQKYFVSIILFVSSLVFLGVALFGKTV